MSNPIFSERAVNANTVLTGEPMSIAGAINKTAVLFACLLLTSFYEWSLFLKGLTDKAQMLMMVGFVLSIVSFIVIMFARQTIKYMAPVYALSEGLVLGGISVAFEAMYPGIAVQAIASTFMVFFVMLGLYKVGAIRCTDKFRSIMMVAMLSIFGIYLMSFIGSFFGYQIPQIFTSSPIGIGFSAIICVIAALNFIIDFDFIEKGSQQMLDKSMEWYGAFGLMVTFVWLYLEILRLLAKLRDR